MFLLTDTDKTPRFSIMSIQHGYIGAEKIVKVISNDLMKPCATTATEVAGRLSFQTRMAEDPHIIPYAPHRSKE